MSAVLHDLRNYTSDSIENKIARAHAVLEQLLLSGAPACVAASFGKDSSAALNLLLTTAARLRRQGIAVAPIVVTHADTGIENPSMVQYARGEMKQVAEYARANDLEVVIEVAHPNLSETWPVRVIGGRALPSYPGQNRDCTTELKISSMHRLRKRVMRELRMADGVDRPEPVVLLGTRFEESVVRAANMRKRGESDVEVRRGIDGNGRPSNLFLSPIAYWSSDDVWEYLGMVRGGALDGYSTFERTLKIYSDAMGVSCVIVAEDMSKSLKGSKACGARHGCSLCVATGDKDASMENMLETDPAYAYMRPLNRLRNFLMAIRWDMDRRSWLGRSINKGYVRVAPDAFSPGTIEELLRYALTIDIEERAAARREGLAPRFQLVDLEQLFAIDAMWSLNAFHKPFHALSIWDEVTNRGLRYPVPEIDAFPRPKDLPARYLYVGQDWEDGERMAYTGLRSAIHELVSLDNQDGCMGTRPISDGRSVMDVNTGAQLEFDVEGCCFVLDDLPTLLREHHDRPGADPTEAYHYYARLGVMSIKNGMQGEIDQILRRSSWKVRQGLAGPIDGRALWDRGVTAEAAGIEQHVSRRARGPGARSSVGHALLVEDPADELRLEIERPHQIALDLSDAEEGQEAGAAPRG
jgi:3'-phosphoadenosine 5'-phosphosulfate sulfotransferase (PAPS reductase)/FAD synthetase